MKLDFLRGKDRKSTSVTLGTFQDPTTDEAGDEAGHASLGMTLRDLTPPIAERMGLPRETKGVVVIEVEAGEAAEAAGLIRGDVIVSVNGQPVATTADFEQQITAAKPGRPRAAARLQLPSRRLSHDRTQAEVRTAMTTRKTEDNDRERYLLLRGMLEDRRREIHEKLRSLREAIPAASHDVRDAEEQSVDEFVQEVDLALMQMKSETLKKIDARDPAARAGKLRALPGVRRSEIAAARLRALPFAVLCRDCQEQTEDRVRYEREAKAFARLQKELASVDAAHRRPRLRRQI